MPDALWVQRAGVDYDAAEDRHIIKAMYNPGVIDGLVISAGTGLQARVSSGRAVVDDGAGGAFLAYFTSTTTISSLTPSAANNLYLVVDPTGATQPTIVRSGTTPTSPSLLLGSAVTSTSAVTSSNNTAAKAEVPTVGGRYLPIAGGTVTGKAQLNNVDIGPGAFVVSGAFAPKFPLGLRIGGAGSATMRYYLRSARGTQQFIFDSAWTPLIFDTDNANINDYLGAGRSGAKFYAPVQGQYQLSGSATFNGTTTGNSTNTTGARRSRIARYNSAGTLIWARKCADVQAADTTTVWFEGLMDAAAGDYFQFELSHSYSSGLYTATGGYATSLIPYGSITLLAAH